MRANFREMRKSAMAKAKYTYNPKRKEWYTLVYDGTYTATGLKHRKRISSKKSSADLEKKVIAFKQELVEKGSARACPYTFGEYAQIWLSTSKATKEQNTRRMYESVLSSCFNGVNHIPLVYITHTHFQSCINEKHEHPRTCQQISITFKQIIKSAVRDHYLPKSAIEDILTDISLPKYQKPQKRPLSPLEKQAIFSADLDPRKRAFISVLYYCGLRKSEALALTPDDFDWGAQTVSITKAWINNVNTPSIKPYPKSDNGIRVVPIPDEGVQYIRPFIESCDGYVFRGSQRLMTETSYRTMWNSIITSLNIAVGYNPQQKNPKPVRPIKGLTAHVFRHNYCTELCYQVPTLSTKMIARLMGDSERMVLEVYSHLDESKENVAAAINNIFTQK